MKICLKENEFNPNLLYQSWCDEEKAKLMGYTIVEIDDAYRDCSFEDFDGFEFNVEKYNARKQKEIDGVKLSELINWFDNYFDKQLTQSQWQDDFVVSHDSYFNKDYANIEELKTQAKTVRDEIRKLRNTTKI